jgi:hypothetical protein
MCKMSGSSDQCRALKGPSCCVKCWEIVERPSDGQLLKAPLHVVTFKPNIRILAASSSLTLGS